MGHRVSLFDGDHLLGDASNGLANGELKLQTLMWPGIAFVNRDPKNWMLLCNKSYSVGYGSLVGW